MSARPIGEILAPVIERAHRMATLQTVIAGMSSASQRKRLIVTAYETEIITADDCRLLMEAHGLETA